MANERNELERPSFLPSASLENLRRRALLLESLRRFFHSRGFWEVETPILSRDTVIDRFLDPIPVADPCDAPSSLDSRRTSTTRSRYWLQTSPEFGMKRLLAAGAEAIFQVTRAFRRDELGPLHNPEFTMVEWYRVGDDMDAGIDLLSDLASNLLERGTAARCTYSEAFEQHLGLAPLHASIEAMADIADQHAIMVPDSLPRRSTGLEDVDGMNRDEWLNILLAEGVQPHLGRTCPMIVTHFPASQAALARFAPGPEPTAERFELYVDGMELANGYHELLDATVLAQRQTKANTQRVTDGKAALPEDNHLLDAMRQGLPPCTGVALGFDRLAMIALKAQSISEVIAFPFDRA